MVFVGSPVRMELLKSSRESGFYVPVASVPSYISPRGLTVVSNATRGHGAAASSLSESGFYVPAASVPSGASLRCHTVVSNAPRGYGAAASSPRSYPDAANADTSGENPTIGPPPSYEDAMRNDNQNHAKDPMLPTYEEVTDGTPADKQTFL
ncbi:uncharacterized protein LOC135496108 [Lineus longissimus]|uniref:uncharacterized protein LOC135496108 n=1 Tax=Lineus longissimus TaxID=88925 RepID=UPI00315D278A